MINLTKAKSFAFLSEVTSCYEVLVLNQNYNEDSK